MRTRRTGKQKPLATHNQWPGRLIREPIHFNDCSRGRTHIITDHFNDENVVRPRLPKRNCRSIHDSRLVGFVIGIDEATNQIPRRGFRGPNDSPRFLQAFFTRVYRELIEKKKSEIL